jgi:hypothetical protein
MSSSKNHFLVVGGVKMRSKKSAGTPKRKNDKAIASDSNFRLEVKTLISASGSSFASPFGQKIT